MAMHMRSLTVSALCVTSLVVFSGVSVVSAVDVRVIEDVSELGGAESQVPPPSDVMMDLLNWATQHSDPERVKELMEMYAAKNLTVRDIYGQDVFDALFVDEPDIMLRSIWTISNFGNSTIDDDSLEGALIQLQNVVEQVDHAGNLHGMGGLRPLLAFAISSERSAELRALALWTIGVAVTNNAPVQADLRSLDGVRRLASLLPRCGGVGAGAAAAGEGAEYCGKLLYALSAAIRNDEIVQGEADGLGVFDWLVDVGAPHSHPAIAKKAMGLLDTALAQSPNLVFVDGITKRQDTIAKTILTHLGTAEKADTDRAEKALRLVNRFLTLRPYLFASSFRVDLAAAVRAVVARCEAERAGDDESLEVCEGLTRKWKHADVALSVRELSDDEL